MDQASTLQSAFNRIKRLPPAQIRKNVAVRVCLVLGTDPKNGYDYLKCEYNRDYKSHRSPWSNFYYPEASEAYNQSP